MEKIYCYSIRIVLRKKNSLDFLCTANTLEELNKKIEKSYQLQKGMKPRGINFTKEDYMIDKVISKVTIEDLE